MTSVLGYNRNYLKINVMSILPCVGTLCADRPVKQLTKG